MSVNKAVHKLNVDLSHLSHAKKAEAKDVAAEKKAGATEKSTRAKIAQQAQQIYDQFESGTLDTAHQLSALHTLYGLGEKDQKAVDAYGTAMSHAKSALAHDKKAVSTAHKHGLKDLKAAEYHLGLKQTNKDRRALGLKSLKHTVRPPHRGADVLKAARSVKGHNIQQLKYSGPLAKYLDKWPSSHVCCANFVSACLQKEGLIKHSEHNDSVVGLAHNLGHDKNWHAVSSHNMKPGDVVSFEVPGEGHMAHVEIFSGYKHGVAQFIGSNNVNSDGSQRVVEGHVGYHIDKVYRHK